MGRFIVKLDGDEGPRWLEWSSVVDAPVTFGMTLEEFRKYYREEYGRSGMQELEERLARCEAKGTSSHIHASARELISINRVGPDRRRLTMDELYRAYGLYQPIRGGWLPPTAEE